MKKFKFNKDFKIKLSIIILSFLIFIGILSYQFDNINVPYISTIIGFLIIAVILFSFKGLTNTLLKKSKPITKKKYIHLFIVAITCCTIMYILVKYIMEAIKTFM